MTKFTDLDRCLKNTNNANTFMNNLGEFELVGIEKKPYEDGSHTYVLSFECPNHADVIGITIEVGANLINEEEYEAYIEENK